MRHKLEIREDIDCFASWHTRRRRKQTNCVEQQSANHNEVKDDECHKGVPPPAALCHRQFGWIAIDRRFIYKSIFRVDLDGVKKIWRP